MQLDWDMLDPDYELRAALAFQSGTARQAFFPDCKDGWVICYTTTRVEGGPAAWRGKFLTMAYKPIGKGARSGNASEWKQVYVRPFVQRKTARARAEKLYQQHNR